MVSLSMAQTLYYNLSRDNIVGIKSFLGSLCGPTTFPTSGNSMALMTSSRLDQAYGYQYTIPIIPQASRVVGPNSCFILPKETNPKAQPIDSLLDYDSVVVLSLTNKVYVIELLIRSYGIHKIIIIKNSHAFAYHCENITSSYKMLHVIITLQRHYEIATYYMLYCMSMLYTQSNTNHRKLTIS